MAEDDHGVVSDFGCLRRRRQRRRNNKVHTSSSANLTRNLGSKSTTSIDEICAKDSSDYKEAIDSTLQEKSSPNPTLRNRVNNGFNGQKSSVNENGEIGNGEISSITELEPQQLKQFEDTQITVKPNQLEQQPVPVENPLLTLKSESEIQDQEQPESNSATPTNNEPTPELLIQPNLLFPLRGPLLGSEEMEKYLPNRQIIVHITTWNMGSLPLPNSEQLTKLFEHEGSSTELIGNVDIHAIGIQECWQDNDAWELLLQTTLGNGFGLFHSLNLGSLHLCIFIRRDLLWFTTEPIDYTQSVRAGRLFKTKGSTAISFGFFGSRFLFINAHLSAGTQDKYASQRVDELRKIITASEKNHEHNYDAVFLFGDLNFRIYGLKYEKVLETLLKDKNICTLLEKDQLNYIFRRKDTLPDFLEPFHEAAAITFMPTYKYDIGSDTFDSSSKQRAPAYTDRIIYKNRILPNGNANVYCIAYDGIFNMKLSDHRPVYGVFSIQLKPGFDTLQISGARFKRELYIKAIQNQAKVLLERRKRLASSICIVC